MSETTISTVSNITIVTLQDTPADVKSMSNIFNSISKYNINIDMISMAPTHTETTGLSFTISDDDLVDILAYIKHLKKDKVNVIVNSLNHKISVYSEAMKNTPGVAARVFELVAGTNADIRLITTSEVEISFLVSEADFDAAYQALAEEFNK